MLAQRRDTSGASPCQPSGPDRHRIRDPEHDRGREVDGDPRHPRLSRAERIVRGNRGRDTGRAPRALANEAPVEPSMHPLIDAHGRPLGCASPEDRPVTCFGPHPVRQPQGDSEGRSRAPTEPDGPNRRPLDPVGASRAGLGGVGRYAGFCPVGETDGGDHLSGAPLSRRLGAAHLGRDGRTTLSLLGLAPGGACRATTVTRRAGELLPHRFTLTRPSPARRGAPRGIDGPGGLLSVALSACHHAWALPSTLS
jgi:hypothetical protein